MSERIDLPQFEGLMESIVICEEEYIKGQDSLLEDCQTLKDRMQIVLAELKRCYEEIDRLNHAAHTCDDCGGHRESVNDCENVCQCS
tara:strand:- start:3947 stop:4207 length:261 start_codon:yes stop_codon:yes gene_type:complete